MSHSCENINYCDNCNSCCGIDYCRGCYYCKNLKMTEYNIFCYSEEYNNENSFQQKRYRVFNKEVGKERYDEIRGQVKEILEDFVLRLGLGGSSWKDEWKKVSNEQWKQLLEIPEAKDFKKGFEFISGIEINLDDTIEITVEGKTKRINRQSAIKWGLI